MKLISKSVYIVLFLVFVISCGLPYCRRTNLNENELEWTKYINDNDTVIFEGDNYLDTLVYFDKQTHNKSFISIFDLDACNWLEGENDYNAHTSVDFTFHHLGKEWKGHFLIIKYDNSDDVYYRFCLGGFFSDGSYLNPEVSLKLSPQDTCFVLTRNVNARDGINQELLGVEGIEWKKRSGLQSITLKDRIILVRKM